MNNLIVFIPGPRKENPCSHGGRHGGYVNFIEINATSLYYIGFQCCIKFVQMLSEYYVVVV